MIILASMCGRAILCVFLPIVALCSISASSTAVEKLSGSEVSDVLVGSVIDDEIYGECGDDLLEGGDVEVRFDNRDWTSLVRTGRSRLDLKLSRDGDKTRLRYSQRF